MSIAPDSLPKLGDPTWQLAERYFPAQGYWTEKEFLDLPENRHIELTDGYLEFLAMPTTIHQFVLDFIHHLLRAFVTKRELGRVIFAGIKLRVRPNAIREPDMLFIKKENYRLISNKVWSGTDLALEVVSPDRASHNRDYELKVNDYAEAGVKEYWIVDPQTSVVTVLVLDGKKYRTHGEFKRGDVATSVILPGFDLDVAAAFDAGILPEGASEDIADEEE